MKPLILFPHEIRRLIDTGSVTLIVDGRCEALEFYPDLATAIHAALDRAEEAGL